MSLDQIEFAKKNPIRYSYWEQMTDVSVLGAALYAHGIDPDAWYNLFDSVCMEDMPYESLPDSLDDTIEIICSAVRGGIIQTSPSDKSLFTNADTKILVKSFLEWFKISLFANGAPPAIAIPQSPSQRNSPSTSQAHQGEPDDVASDFDPLRVDGISKMFPLDVDASISAKKWAIKSKNATRNGLSKARVTIGSGQAQSTYLPDKVGEWLVAKGILDQAKVNRILKSNLPLRSRDNKELYE
jgi:hypothetical protein